MANWWTKGAAAAAAGCLLASGAGAQVMGAQAAAGTAAQAGTAADATAANAAAGGRAGGGSSGSSGSGSSGSGSGSSASSPLARLFGGGNRVANAPVDLVFRVGGADPALETTLRQTSLLTGALAEGRSSGQDMLAAARADYSRLLGTLFDEGYYDAVIDIRLDGAEAAGIAPLDAPKFVQQVVVTVDPGSPFHYTRADIAPLAPATQLPGGYRPGGVARTSDMKKAAQAGVKAWRENGHAKADVASTDIVADHEARSVDSRIALTPGPLVRFGRLAATGNQRLSTRRLLKIAGFPEGERYDPDKLEDVRKRLRRSGIFSSITLQEADTLGPRDAMDVKLTVIEQKLRRVGGGFAVSSVDGAALTGYWLHRNLLGGGERLRVDGEVKDISSGTSSQDYTFAVRLDRPATIRPDLTAFTELRAERLREEDYDLDLGVVGVGLTWLPSDRLTGETRLEYRRSRVVDDTGTTDFRVLALPTSVTLDRREDETSDPKRGYWLNATATPFLGLGDTDSGLRLVGEGRAYRSLGTGDRFTLAGRARAGSLVGSDLARTPRDYLFYSGGGGSVRGQPYESLGVNVLSGPDGPVKTGGMSVANVTGELRVQVREKIGFVAFADAGEVWSEGGFGGDTDWHAGAGLGVRYKTPIGPIRLDVAGPVGGDTGEGVQFYLGLGQAF